MQFAFSTGSLYHYGIARCFDFAAQAGFDGVEVLVDSRWDTRQVDHLRGLAEQYNIPILAVHEPFFFNLPGWPSDRLESLLHSVKLAEALGAHTLIHHLPYHMGRGWLHIGGREFYFPLPWSNPHAGYIHWLQHNYADYQASTAVKLCIENMPAKPWLGRNIKFYLWNTPEEIARFDNLTLDTTHLGTWGLDPVEVYAQWGQKVGHIHLSNFDGREHRRPETGQLRLNVLLAKLATDGYDGAVTLELHPDALEAGDPDARIVELLTNSLAWSRAAAQMPLPESESTATT